MSVEIKTTAIQRFAPDVSVPEADDPVLKLAYRLRTKRPSAVLLRKQTVELVFWIIKRDLSWRQLSMRGLDKARGEWSLATMACKRLHVLRAA